MNFFYANGTPIINSLKVTSEVPLDPRLTVENIAERDSLVTNHISYDRMKVYVKSNDTKYIYHKDTGEWEIDNKFSEEDKSKLDRIDNYLIDTEHIYNPENKLLYREHSYDPNTDITTLRDHILQEARVSENGELYNGLLSKFYVNRLNNITNYLIDVSFTKGTDVPNLYLTTHSYNPDEDRTTLTNIDIPLATDDNHGLLSNLQNIKVNRIVDYVNRIDTTHTNAPDTGLTYNYNIYNPFTNANVTKTILIPLVTHTENGLTSSSDKIKIDDIETYVKSIALRQASGTEELGINYIITNPNDQTDTPGYFNIPLVTDSRNGLVSPARKHWMDNANGVSNTGTASDTWQLDKKDINTRLDPNGGVIIKDSGGIAEIRNNTDSAYSDLTLNNITIKGNVTQEGKSFITEAETVEIKYNTLLLNRGEVGAGVTKGVAGIEIDRGTEPKYQILFDESDDRFKVGKEGDLWCVTLRDDEADMVNGMFTTWDSSTKRLKTTNIVPSSSFLYFGDNKTVSLNYSPSDNGLLKINTNNQYLAIFTGDNYTNFRSTKNKFQFIGDSYTTGTKYALTFKRTSDNSEVLYHADIINDLTSGGTNKVLSAEQGKLLQNSITSIQGSYLPLSGGIMTGSIAVPYGWDIRTNDGKGILKIVSDRSVEVGHLSGVTKIRSYLNDILHIRNDTSYKIYDEFNLPDPARLGSNQTFTGNNTFQVGKFNVGPFKVTSSGSLLLDINSQGMLAWSRNIMFRANSDNTSSSRFGGYNSTDNTSAGYAYIGIGDVDHSTAQYKFRPTSLTVPIAWSLDDPNGNALVWSQNSTLAHLGRASGTTKIRSGNTDLIHTKGSTEYIIWDKSNLPNPVRYTLDASGYPSFQDVNGNNFSYIKAGPSGILPNTSVSLSSGGTGYCGTLGWSFKDGYFANVHTYKILIGPNDAFIDGQSGDSSHRGIGFYTSQNAACPVYVGSLCVSDSYANGAPNIPTNGIYSKGNIYTSSGIVFNNNTWTNNLTPNRNYSGYLQVLDAYNAGGPNSYGTVLQINSRNSHWANQLWFSGGTEISKKGLYYRHMAYNQTEYGDWIKLVTTSDLNSYLTKTEASTLYYPYNGRGYLSITSTGKPVMSNNQGYAVKDKDGNEREVLWMGTNNALYLGNTSQYTLGQLDLRCTTLTHNGNKIATQNYVTNQLSNYLPLTGGIVTGDIKLNTEAALYTAASSGSGYSYYKTISYDNDKGIILGASNTSIKIQSSDPRIYHIYKGTEYEIYSTNSLPTPVFAPGKVAGSLTPIYNNSFYINDSSYKVATIDNSYSFPKIYSPTSAGTSGQILQSTGGVPEWVNASSVVGNFVSKSGDTMTGALTMNNRRENVVVDVVAGIGNNWNEGAGALSIQIPNDNGQTPLLLARRSGATINTTTLSERLLDMELLDTGTIFKVGMSGVNALELEVTSFTNKVGIGKLFGKQIATTDQIPSIPSISISNSGTGNAVTSITANGHTLNVTKGATYLTSHQTIYNLTFQAGTFSAKTFDPNGAAATVNIPTNTSHLTNDSGFITSSALNGYATQSWANSQFAPLKNYFVTGNYASIATTGNEMCIGSLTSGNSVINVNYRNGTGTTSPSTWYWRAGSSTSWANAYWGNLYMNNNLVATQTWSNSQYPLKTGTGASGTWGISITGNAATATTATKWNGYSIWTGTEDELPSSRDANTLYFVKKSS